MERAVARQLAWQLPGGVAMDSDDPAAERTRAADGRLVRGWVTASGGQVTVAAEVEHPRGRVARRETASGPDLIAATADLARAIEPAARPPATGSEEALRLYAETLDAPEPGRFAAAIQADPAFPLPYRSWVQYAAAHRDAAGAEQVLDLARAAGDRLSAEERWDIEAEAAAASGILERALSPLRSLAEARPDDPNARTRVGQAALAARQYEEAARHLERALDLAPPSPGVLWNQLGYAFALGGQREAAFRAFDEYQKLHPRQANPRDSMGEAAFWFGEFRQAKEHFEEAYAAEPEAGQGVALLKAAQAAAFAGDRDAAAEMAAKYFATHAPASAWQAELFLAEWDIARGEGNGARRRLEALDGPGAPGAALILAALSLAEGDRASAARRLAAGAGRAGGPSLAIAAFAAAGSAPPDEWSRRADRAFPSPLLDQTKRVALAWALLVDGHFADADAVLVELERRVSGGVTDTVPALRVWALAGQGRREEAARLNRFTPMLPIQTPSPFPAMTLQKLLALRTQGKL